MKTNKQRPRVGDTCWFVEWTYELAFYEDDLNSIDRDRCKERTRKVATKEEAEQLAREVWPQTTDCFGFVTYWPAEFVPYDEDHATLYPHAGYWEVTNDAECYEGEDINSNS